MKNLVISVKSQSEYDAVIKFYVAKGYRSSGNTYDKYTTDTILIVKHDERKVNFSSGHKHGTKDNETAVSFDAFAAISGVQLTTTIQISSGYQGVIDKAAKTVTVGSSVIPFDRIKAVYDAINS